MPCPGKPRQKFFVRQKHSSLFSLASATEEQKTFYGDVTLSTLGRCRRSFSSKAWRASRRRSAASLEPLSSERTVAELFREARLKRNNKSLETGFDLGSTVVQLLTHNHKVKGLNPGPGSRR
jgi:hypothetical protein